LAVEDVTIDKRRHYVQWSNSDGKTTVSSHIALPP